MVLATKGFACTGYPLPFCLFATAFWRASSAVCGEVGADGLRYYGLSDNLLTWDDLVVHQATRPRDWSTRDCHTRYPNVAGTPCGIIGVQTFTVFITNVVCFFRVGHNRFPPETSSIIVGRTLSSYLITFITLTNQLRRDGGSVFARHPGTFLFRDE